MANPLPNKSFHISFNYRDKRMGFICTLSYPKSDYNEGDALATAVKTAPKKIMKQVFKGTVVISTYATN